MIDGILKIYKEKNITSYDVIRKLKKVLPKGQKIGHAGTLDPFAEGLLLILLGKATKLMNLVHDLEKEYEVTSEFGYMTDTQDCTGNMVRKSNNMKVVTRKDIQKIIKENFLGEISQTPPAYSAVHINGQRAYDLARQGKEVVIKVKNITVKEFSILDYNWPEVTFRVICSTGTYVRTLVNDLGERLGVFATAIALKRVRIGKFDLENTVYSKDINTSVSGSIIDIDKVKEIINNE